MNNVEVTMEMLHDIYNDIKVQQELGIIHPERDQDEFMAHVWFAVAEKLPKKFHPQDVDGNIQVGYADLFSVLFGTVTERLIREHYETQGKDWW